MQDILNKLIETRILNLLETININYPDKFKKDAIDKELNYIKEKIIWKEKSLKIHKSVKIHKPVNKNKNKKNLIKLKTKTNSNIKEKVNKTMTNVKQCSGRIWSKYILDIQTKKKLNDIDNKFKVDDFIDLDLKDFNSKYIIGLRCCKNRFNDNKYCKLHSNHLIHGDYLESPNKELCYHFMKDGKYL